jgi:hypothetical protein
MVIINYEGPPRTNMKLVVFGQVSGFEFDANSPTTYGHHNSALGAGVGAADYLETPAYIVTPPLIEFYSSAGGNTARNLHQSRKHCDFDMDDPFTPGFDAAIDSLGVAPNHVSPKPVAVPTPMVALTPIAVPTSVVVPTPVDAPAPFVATTPITSSPSPVSTKCGLFGWSLFRPFTVCGLFGRLLGFCRPK